MSALNRLVAARDRLHNTARQLEVTARDTETKHICLVCRRVPDVMSLRMDWHEAHRGNQKPWPGVGSVCPACGGRLVSVSW